jgi:hypothetical protein
MQSACRRNGIHCRLVVLQKGVMPILPAGICGYCRPGNCSETCEFHNTPISESFGDYISAKQGVICLDQGTLQSILSSDKLVALGYRHRQVLALVRSHNARQHLHEVLGSNEERDALDRSSSAEPAGLETGREWDIPCHMNNGAGLPVTEMLFQLLFQGLQVVLVDSI